MKIDTEYNIGDEVWIIEDYTSCGTVKHVRGPFIVLKINACAGLNELLDVTYNIGYRSYLAAKGVSGSRLFRNVGNAVAELTMQRKAL